jgi:hypothetical protein
MEDLARREAAAKAVDGAFKRLANHPSTEAMAAYDLAYARWVELAESALRGPGRPQTGDYSMTSTERARAVRERQRQKAAYWEKVAPLIQQLRKAVNSRDDAGALVIARSLVKETDVRLTSFAVVHEQPDSYCVIVHAFDGRELVLAFISRRTLEDYFHRDNVTGKSANLVVDRNLDAFARIISGKYERGQHRPYARAGSTLRRLDITLEDIEVSGETLTDGVLDMTWG